MNGSQAAVLDETGFSAAADEEIIDRNLTQTPPVHKNMFPTVPSVIAVVQCTLLLESHSLTLITHHNAPPPTTASLSYTR